MKLKNTGLSIGVYTTDHEKLAQWYKDKLNFVEKDRMNLPDGTYISFEFGDNEFWIGLHNKITSTKNTDAFRIMIGFRVESVTVTYEEIKNKDIEFIATPFAEPTGSGLWCMTIKDLDGNILQFVGTK